MKKVSESAAQAFINGEHKTLSSNTKVRVSRDGYVRLYLFGNLIATRNKEDNMTIITSCGWRTVTTKDRLNALPSVSITGGKNGWFLNGIPWDGKDYCLYI